MPGPPVEHRAQQDIRNKVIRFMSNEGQIRPSQCTVEDALLLR